jgi:YVTN family beta-propeller protein
MGQINPGNFSSPMAVAFDGMSIWVSDYSQNYVARVDRLTNSIDLRISIQSPSGLVFDGTNIWVAAGDLVVINPQTGVIAGEIDLCLSVSNCQGAFAGAFDGQNLWFTSPGFGNLIKVDPSTRTVSAIVDVGYQPWTIAFDGRFLWTSNTGDPNIAAASKVDPASNEVVAKISLGGISVGHGIAFDGKRIWVPSGGSRVTSIDARTNLILNLVDVGGNPGPIAFDGTNIWVSNTGSSTLSKVDPVTGTVIADIQVSQPLGLAFDGSSIWVANGLGLGRIPT